jgi:hypothetical protein
MNDPNRLLGRPNGYTSKIAFADSRISKTDTDGTQKDAIERGGSIEVFPDAELAMGRAEYIQGVLKNSGLGAEYDYIPRWKPSGLRRCTRLGSRSSPGSERTINRFPTRNSGHRSVRELTADGRYTTT